MLQIMNQSEGALLGLRCVGRITKSDYAMIEPLMEDLIRQHGSINLLCEMSSFESVSLGGVWEDLSFALKHKGKFRKMALVGAMPWILSVSTLGERFFGVEIKAFEAGHVDEAWDWLSQ